MLHIILIILKIIGILLLVILGIVLSILLLILFAPFRYAVDGEKGEEICFHARITWVFFFLRVMCSFEKKKLVYYVKVFGYPLVSNEEKKKKAKKKKVKKKKKEKSLSEEEQLLLSEIEEEANLEVVELEQAKEREKMREKAAKNKEDQKEESKEEKKEVQKEKIREKTEKKTITSKKKEVKSVHSESEMAEEEEQKKEKTQTKKIESEREQKEKFSKKFEKRWRKNPINIIRGILYKIRDIVYGILEKIRKIFYRLNEFKEKIDGLLEKAREWMEFIDEEMTKKAISKLIKIIKKLLKHILPRKIEGNLTFGLEDPAMMGRILAILGMAMPIYKNNLNIQPCFDANMLQGNIKAKGKIRLAYLLYLAILVLIDKGIMGTIKKARAMAKGEKESKGGE